MTQQEKDAIDRAFKEVEDYVNDLDGKISNVVIVFGLFIAAMFGLLAYEQGRVDDLEKKLVPKMVDTTLISTDQR